MNRRTFTLAICGSLARVVLRSQQKLPPEAPERKLQQFATLPVVVPRVSQGWYYDEDELKFHRDTQRHSAIDFRGARSSGVYAAADGLAVHSFHTVHLDKP